LTEFYIDKLPGSSGELRLSANTFHPLHFTTLYKYQQQHSDIMPGSSEELRLSANTSSFKKPEEYDQFYKIKE